MATQASYVPLEGGILSSIGGKQASFDTAATPSFFASTSFLYTFSFVIILAAASFMYAHAGVLRMQANEEGLRKSKEEFARVTYGLLGVLGLWLILFTVNKDMLTGDVTLSALKITSTPSSGLSTGGNGNTGTGGGSSGTSASCNNADAIKASLQSNGGICGNATCSRTNCISSTPYKSMIQAAAGDAWKMALVIMCKESNGDKNAQNKNPDGTYDCGLMQVNQPGPCDAQSLDPQANIAKGVALLKGKMSAQDNVRQYPTLKVRPETGIFTAYNCCSNGTSPNSQSASCKTSDGWPEIPKWACPIDPGTGKFNMCGVKAYACDLTACLDQL